MYSFFLSFFEGKLRVRLGGLANPYEIEIGFRFSNKLLTAKLLVYY
jgi:hypothetical protein